MGGKGVCEGGEGGKGGRDAGREGGRLQPYCMHSQPAGGGRVRAHEGPTPLLRGCSPRLLNCMYVCFRPGCGADIDSQHKFTHDIPFGPE